ncbi:carboxylic acid transport protein [Pseudovirgaria hyperparasitica]|uniref:Carboxylic acid transport protein n=1 Tax=Pseudovirgaria hyperparasitica TaxID=470096 RepID=A0A6A6VXW6_9PEZI|nr:carboxylic acid transport protein [Pseudovirgaria hyperparasitica]KAF2755025.1 carboxylic acid transport protein [Pseudovirgaria hyperparasitica]
MATQNEPADPIVRGTLATAKQSFRDLFVWKQRVVVTNEFGETYTEWQSPEPLKNPFTMFAQLSFKDWLFFLVGLFSWTADAFDFHSLSIQTTKLAKYYGKTNTDITTAITLTLLLRSVGAAFFGLAGDKFGRKWPMVINMIILGILQVATIYCGTFSQFLAIRSLFGLFMGGVYGNAIAMALENCPTQARGLMSGILQQGYSFGYVLAACANLAVGGETNSWKTVFWAGAGLSIGMGLVRALFPESKQFIEARKAGKKAVAPGAFWLETKQMLKQEWRMVVYCIILMTWFNYYSHTSQDSYTTFMKDSKELSNGPASRASIIMKTGACVGGTIIGYVSQWFGRRRAIIVAALMSCLMIPAWVLPEGERSLSASGFFMQFFVQGAWGVIPIHLNELSPPSFRSSFPGITYQLGNMISSPSAQIVNAIAERRSLFVTSTSGDKVPAYGPTMAIATAIIAIGIAVTTALGPERKGRSFENALPIGAAHQTKDIEEGDLSRQGSSSDEKVRSEKIEVKA